MRKALIFFLFLLTACTTGKAQDTLSFNGKHYQFLRGVTDTASANGKTYIIKYVVEPEMGDTMRSNGKIYVVIMVLATIFAGIFAYLLLLNRSISRLEKDKKS